MIMPMIWTSGSRVDSHKKGQSGLIRNSRDREEAFSSKGRMKKEGI
jgi:hypothetical protein